jgi:hypothetical protein
MEDGRKGDDPTQVLSSVAYEGARERIKRWLSLVIPSSHKGQSTNPYPSESSAGCPMHMEALLS